MGFLFKGDFNVLRVFTCTVHQILPEKVNSQVDVAVMSSYV